MYVRETGVEFTGGANWGFGMSVHFRLLTFQALGNPFSDVRVHIGPYKAIGDELDCGSFARMGSTVQVPKYTFPKRWRNVWSGRT